MKQRDLSYELYLLNGLRKGDQDAFSTLFTIYYKDLVMFGGNFLTNRKDCEDIVQSIFLKLWNDREVIKIETALKSYLLTAVRNGCLNVFDLLHHNKVFLAKDAVAKIEEVLS